MARHEQDREDLLREATALLPRGEFRLESLADSVVIGFRGDAASVYFGAEPSWHFNPTGELRRAYADGCLLKAESARLIRMQRVRAEGEVQLRSRPLSAEEQTTLLASLRERLRWLDHQFRSGSFELIGEAPGAGQILPKAIRFLETVLATPLRVAAAPHVGVRREE